MVNGSVPQYARANRCVKCHCEMEVGARFCGDCGVSVANAPAAPRQIHQHAPQVKSQNPTNFAHNVDGSGRVRSNPGTASKSAVPNPNQKPNSNFTNSAGNKSVPQFAHLSGGKKKRRVNPELTAELGGLLALLLRERIFLVIHCIIFLVVNIFGFSLSIECYTGYIGDEATKIVMAMTPLLFINTVGLACMSPIKGTKKEIARIKEKIQYLRFRMDYEGWV